MAKVDKLTAVEKAASDLNAAKDKLTAVLNTTIPTTTPEGDNGQELHKLHLSIAGFEKILEEAKAATLKSTE